VWDHCAALDMVLRQGKPESLITFVKDRPGHDRRYAIDASKIKRELGWQPKISFEQGLRKTIDWYCTNRGWWEKIKTGEYRQYYQGMYGQRQVLS